MLKLSKSKVLLLNIGGLGVEIAKNIVLAGVNSLTIIDHKPCQIKDIGCQFYISEEHVAKNLTRLKL